MSQVHCYNKGCAQLFDPENNNKDSCKYHPGAPIFHDALKSWSCCSKKSTDFSEFLNIPGCASGLHSNVKPPAVQSSKPNSVLEISNIVSEPPKKPICPPNNPNNRPPVDEPRIELKKTVLGTLQQALEKQLEELTLQTNTPDSSKDTEVAIGTTCKNKACGKTYNGIESNEEECIHHPGAPVFHEGLKYWSCCQKKTTEFDNFLQQVGCQTGHHVWIKQGTIEEKKSCRFDWHQTGSSVNISVYSKLAIPDKCHVEANRVSCDVRLVFEGGKSLFEQTFILCGVIDAEKSSVKMAGTKVEINLKKGEVFHWPNLEKLS